MIAEGHVVARAVALLGFVATLFGVGVEISIQVVMLFRVAAILAVLRKLDGVPGGWVGNSPTPCQASPSGACSGVWPPQCE